jgi:hypothetical protein
VLNDRQLPRQWRTEFDDPQLAHEFRAAPMGPHSDRLRRLLIVMRSAAPMAGRPLLVDREDGRLDVGVVPEVPGDPIVVPGDPVAQDDWPEAERRAFALRWKTVFGKDVPW